MSDILNFPTKPRLVATTKHDPVPDVVEKLEHLLKLARLGRINGIAYACSFLDDKSGEWTYYIGHKTDGRGAVATMLVAGTAVLQVDIVQSRHLDETEHVYEAEEVALQVAAEKARGAELRVAEPEAEEPPLPGL